MPAKCKECEQVITHPMCMACLTEQMEAWLRDRRPDLIPELRATADVLWSPTKETHCIQCNHKMNVCTYCFTRHILDWLRDYPRLIQEYATIFTYDLEVEQEQREIARVPR